MTATNILMINCPEVSFVYNAEKFIETKNKGIKDYGGETQLIGTHKVIEKTDEGKISFADPLVNKVYTHKFTNSANSNT